MMPKLPPSWAEPLAADLAAPYFATLAAFVAAERAAGAVFPPEPDVFAALHLTPLDQVRVVLMGQDPYHGAGQAHGLSFSVPPGIRPPPSLANMLKELQSDLGLARPDHGDLTPWGQQGVLLLNTVLTVPEGKAGAHRRKGWERFTAAIMRAVDARAVPSVFVLWGNEAKKSAPLIDRRRHRILEGVHPSPLSAHAGFHGSKPFSRINRELEALGHAPIDWKLPILDPESGTNEKIPY
jgi:uracil-DNA glycosylase